MRHLAVRVLLASAVGGLVFLSAGPAAASPGYSPAGAVAKTTQAPFTTTGPATPSATPSPGTPTGPAASDPAESMPPTGPVDPGTGETGETKETRTDYAPYYIAAVAIILAIVVVLLWRRRGRKTIV